MQVPANAGAAMSEVITKEMEQIRAMIAQTVAKRSRLKNEMEAWYAENSGRFEHSSELITLDATLSNLDTHYKKLWDYYNAKEKAC